MKLFPLLVAFSHGNTDFEAQKAVFESAIEEIGPLVQMSKQFSELTELNKQSTLSKLEEIRAVASYWQDFLLSESEREDCREYDIASGYFGPSLKHDDVCHSTGEMFYAVLNIIKDYACSEEKFGNQIDVEAFKKELFNKFLRIINKLGCPRRVLYDRL